MRGVDSSASPESTSSGSSRRSLLLTRQESSRRFGSSRGRRWSRSNSLEEPPAEFVQRKQSQLLQLLQGDFDDVTICDFVRHFPKTCATPISVQERALYPLSIVCFVRRLPSRMLVEHIYQAFPRAILQKDALGMTALHYICQQGKYLPLHEQEEQEEQQHENDPHDGLEESEEHSLSDDSLLLDRILDDHDDDDDDESSQQQDEEEELCTVLDFLLEHTLDATSCSSSTSDTTLLLDNDGWSPLHWACAQQPTLAMVQTLHQAMPQTLALRDTKTHWLPLHMACAYHASHTVVQYLLQHFPTQTPPPLQNSHLSPLHLACVNNSNPQVLQALLTHFPDSIQQPEPSDDWWPLHLALHHNDSLPVIQLLLQTHPKAVLHNTRSNQNVMQLAQQHASNRTPQLQQQVLQLLQHTLQQQQQEHIPTVYTETNTAITAATDASTTDTTNKDEPQAVADILNQHTGLEIVQTASWNGETAYILSSPTAQPQQATAVVKDPTPVDHVQEPSQPQQPQQDDEIKPTRDVVPPQEQSVETVEESVDTVDVSTSMENNNNEAIQNTNVQQRTKQSALYRYYRARRRRKATLDEEMAVASFDQAVNDFLSHLDDYEQPNKPFLQLKQVLKQELLEKIQAVEKALLTCSLEERLALVQSRETWMHRLEALEDETCSSTAAISMTHEEEDEDLQDDVNYVFGGESKLPSHPVYEYDDAQPILNLGRLWSVHRVAVAQSNHPSIWMGGLLVASCLELLLVMTLVATPNYAVEALKVQLTLSSSQEESTASNDDDEEERELGFSMVQLRLKKLVRQAKKSKDPRVIQEGLAAQKQLDLLRSSTTKTIQEETLVEDEETSNAMPPSNADPDDSVVAISVESDSVLVASSVESVAANSSDDESMAANTSDVDSMVGTSSDVDSMVVNNGESTSLVDGGSTASVSPAVQTDDVSEEQTTVDAKVTDEGADAAGSALSKAKQGHTTVETKMSENDFDNAAASALSSAKPSDEAPRAVAEETPNEEPQKPSLKSVLVAHGLPSSKAALEYEISRLENLWSKATQSDDPEKIQEGLSAQMKLKLLLSLRQDLKSEDVLSFEELRTRIQKAGEAMEDLNNPERKQSASPKNRRLGLDSRSSKKAVVTPSVDLRAVISRFETARLDYEMKDLRPTDLAKRLQLAEEKTVWQKQLSATETDNVGNAIDSNLGMTERTGVAVETASAAASSRDDDSNQVERPEIAATATNEKETPQNVDVQKQLEASTEEQPPETLVTSTPEPVTPSVADSKQLAKNDTESERVESPQPHRLHLFQSVPLATIDHKANQHNPIPMLDFDAEAHALKQAIADAKPSGPGVEIELETATVDRLSAVIARGDCRVLHLSCHGHEEYLAIEDGWGGMQQLRVEELKRFMTAGAKNLDVVFISACYSQAAANAFLEAGVRHVVCCQWDQWLLDTAAIEFARIFYRSLACHNTLKEAFDMAREAVRISLLVTNPSTEVNKFLLLPEQEEGSSYHDITVFPAEGSLVAGPSSPLADKKKKQAPRILPHTPQFFVGRQVDMYKILSTLRSADVVHLTGARGVGKQSLAAAVCRYVAARKESFMLDDVFWLPFLAGGVASDGDEFQEDLYHVLSCLQSEDEIMDWRNSVQWNRIARELQRKKVLLVVDGKSFSSSSSAAKLAVFLNDILRVARVKIILVASGMERGIFQACREEIIEIGGLDFMSSALLFGNHSKHISQKHCHTVHSAEEFAAFLSRRTPKEAGEPENCAVSSRQKVLFERIGGGIPARIRSTAANMTEVQFDELIRTAKKPEFQVNSRDALEREIGHFSLRRQDALQRKDFARVRDMDEVLVELEDLRVDFPSLDELIDRQKKLHAKLDAARTSRPWKTSRPSFSKQSDSTSSLQARLRTLERRIAQERWALLGSRESRRAISRTRAVSVAPPTQTILRFDSLADPRQTAVFRLNKPGSLCSLSIYTGSSADFHYASGTNGIICWTNESCLLGEDVHSKQVASYGGEDLKQDIAWLPVVYDSTWGPVYCEAGDAVMLGPRAYGCLKAGNVILAVVPDYPSGADKDGNHPEREAEIYVDTMVRSAYRASLKRAGLAHLNAVALSLFVSSHDDLKSSRYAERALRIGLETICEEVYPGLQEIHVVGSSPEETSAIVFLAEEMGLSRRRD